MSDDELPPMPRWYGTSHPEPRQPDPPTDPEPTPPASAQRPAADTDPAVPPEELVQPQHSDHGDLSPAEAARQTGHALFGRDLIAPGRWGWPFGQAAHQRREQRAAVRERTRARRQALAQQWNGPPPGPVPGRWRPVARTRNLAVIATLVTVVAAVMGLGWWITSGQSKPAPAAQDDVAAPVPSASVAPSASSPPPSQPAPGGGLPQRDPIPSGGVAPIVPPAAKPGPDPRSVTTVPVPSGAPTRAELSTPESAARAWMARWCPFDYHQPYGTSQRRARAAMTELGWSAFNPADSDRGRSSWDKTVAAKETARCSAPSAQIVPEAPRSPQVAMVQVTARRVVTGPGAPPYVETLTQTRIVKRGTDGLWRVGMETRGG